MNVRSREARAFSLVPAQSPIGPGKTGRFAVVTSLTPGDLAKGADNLLLEVFRDGGLRELWVELDIRKVLRSR